MEEWHLKAWIIFYQFGITIPCSATYFLEIGVHVSLKVATKSSIGGKRNSKFRFLASFSKGKTEESNLKIWYIFNQFGITVPCSATYLLEVGARVSLKEGSKGSIRDKKDSEKLEF